MKARLQGKLKIVDVILALILGFGIVMAPDYISKGDCFITVGLVLSGVIASLIILFLETVFPYLIKEHKTTFGRNNSRRMIFKKVLEGRHPILTLSLLLILFWLIPLLFLFPGTLINDTWWELGQYTDLMNGLMNLNNHHPILDTLFMGSIIVPFAHLTGRWHAAIFIYVMIQAILTAIAFSTAMVYCYKKLKVSASWIRLLFLIYGISPWIPISVQTVSKDALFSWIYVYFVIGVIEIMRTEGASLACPRFFTLFTVVAILCGLTKKVGVYVVLGSVIFLLLFLRRRTSIFIHFVITAVVLLMIYPKVVAAFGIPESGKQEMFSLPFQMTARYVISYGDEIPEDEKEIIDRVLDYDKLPENYDPLIADPVKGYIQKGTDNDYREYIKVWLKEGLRHPRVYFDATAAMLSGWFSTTSYIPLTNMDWHNQLIKELIPEWVPVRSKTSSRTAAIWVEFITRLGQLPVIGYLMSYGFLASVCPFFIVSLLLKKKEKTGEKGWLILVPLVLSIIGGCWLAPVSIDFEGLRYLYPVTYTLPIYLGYAVHYVNYLSGTKTRSF